MSNAWINSSTWNYWLVSESVVKYTCDQAPGGGNDLAQPTNQWQCIAGGGATQAVRKESANHQVLPLHSHHIGIQMVSETWKVNLLLGESQYFTITLGCDLKGHFVHTIYFFIHTYIAIHHHRYLEAVRFCKTTIFETGTLSLQRKCHESSWKLSY